MSGADPALLDTLAEQLFRARGGVSADTLAARLDCPPNLLEAWMGELRELGAPFVAMTGGYALALDDPLDAAAIRAGLRKYAAMTVKLYRVCSSTRDALRRLAPPALCLAEVQTAGRGRRGTEWRQAFGTGLALSLAAPTPRGRLDPLAVALAVSVARCLEAAGYAGVRIKWPNDLYVRGAKLGGLMIETEGGAPGYLSVGLGINVHSAPKLSGRETVALAELDGPPPTRNRLAAALALTLMDALRRYDAEGFAAFAEEFAARDWLANRNVTLCDGGLSIEGVARGIDDFGALVLETGGGSRLCRAGEVTRVSSAERLWTDA